MMTREVAKVSDAQSRAIAAAALPRTLMGGTHAMRGAGTRFLPKMAAEPDAAYQARLARSTLFNAFRKTVDDMTGKVFSKPIVLQQDVPTEIKTYCENVDQAGRHINVFARDLLHDAMQSGIAFILVDAPPKPEGVRTKADEIAVGQRPYLVHITLENLIGWKAETINGVESLTQIRIREFVREPDGEFNEKTIEQIRVIEPGKWRTFRRQTSDSTEWVPHEEGASDVQKVMLVPFYTNRTGFMSGRPPLADLADLNVTHWQSASDQRNILTVARVPVLFGTGFTEDEDLVVGASTMIRTSNPDATLKYVEHTGTAINAGREDLKDLEFQMQAMGLQLLVPEQGAKTATGELRDDAKENSRLATIARGLGDAIEQALGYMAEMMGIAGTDKGGSVLVNTDFGTPAGDITSLLAAHNAGVVSRSTVQVELQRRGFLSGDFDAEAEADRIESENSGRTIGLDD